MSTIGSQAFGERSATEATRKLAWPHIRHAAKVALVIAALMAVAMTPAVIRLWLFFPVINNG